MREESIKFHLTDKINREIRVRRMPVLSEKIVQLAQEHGRISIAFISTALDANRNTVKKHVRQLVENRHLVKHGKGRGTYYSPY